MSSLAATQSDGFSGRRDGGLSKFNTNGQYNNSIPMDNTKGQINTNKVQSYDLNYHLMLVFAM